MTRGIETLPRARSRLPRPKFRARESLSPGYNWSEVTLKKPNSDQRQTSPVKLWAVKGGVVWSSHSLRIVFHSVYPYELQWITCPQTSATSYRSCYPLVAVQGYEATKAVAKKAKKKIRRLQRDSIPWPPQYQCNAPQTELWSHPSGGHGFESRWSLRISSGLFL